MHVQLGNMRQEDELTLPFGMSGHCLLLEMWKNTYDSENAKSRILQFAL